MAKAKKTKEEKLEPIGEIKMAPSEKLEQCEWVFQFDEDEPQIFAWTSEDRELTDAGKKLREFQTQQSQLVKTNIQNESTNKED
jgi:hypothetical protein